MLDTLNAHFQTVFGISSTQSTGLQVAYFGAYFINPPTFASFVVRRYGYRYTFIAGLLILGVGSFMFWPCAKFESFGGFCGAMFIVGVGLSTLETAADPYTTMCGPTDKTELRINLAQSFQGAGTFVSPLIASHTFFNGANAYSLTNVQWVYLAVGSFVFILSIVFYVADIPEITDEDMHQLTEEANGVYNDKERFLKQWPLFWAIFAQFCYVGAQVSLASFFINYAHFNAGIAKTTASNLLSVAQAIYCGVRFIASFMLHLGCKPQYMYSAFISGCILFAALAAGLHGKAGLACYIIVFAFESCCFAMIFGMGMRGLGRHSKRGGAGLVMGISGGMCWPSLTGVVADNVSYRVSAVIPMCGYILASTYAVYVVIAYRKLDNKVVVSSSGESDLDDKEVVETIEELHVAKA